MKLICFDMDGVIFEHANFWMQLHKAYGVYEEGLNLTKQHLKTNYPKLVQEVIGRLWKGKSAQPYHNLIKKMKYLPGVKPTFKELKRRGYKIAILSSGPDDLAKRAQKELGVDYIYTNKLLIKNNKIAGSTDLKYWPIRDANKATALKELCQKHNLFLKEAVVVCHEANDIKIAKIAGLAIAFKPHDEELEKYCNVIIKKKDLREILKHL